MNPSGNHMLNELSVLYTIGVAAANLNPSTSFIWENIKTGKEVLEFIGDISEWTSYERNLNENLDSLRNKKMELICMEKDLIDEVEATEFRNNGKRKREVNNWLRNVRVKVADVDFREEETQRRNFVTRFLFRAWFGKCVKDEEEEVDKLITRRGALGSGPDLVLDASEGVIQYQLVTTDLIGEVSSKTRLKIWTNLLNRKVRTLGIVGEQGLGKTTVIRNVYKLEVGYSGLFDRGFYVNVQQGLDLYQLQAAIGDAMNLLDLVKIKCVSRRATRIHKALKSCGKFLLILDGLCEYFRLNEVGIPIEVGGGKVVVVTRSQSVGRKMCEKIIQMEKMTVEDSEELFWKVGRLSPAEISPDIVDLGKKIVRECEGFPSRIVDTAVGLRGVDDICEWRVKLRELHSNSQEKR